MPSAGTILVPGTLEMTIVQAAPLAGDWQMLQCPVPCAFLPASCQLSFVMLLLNIEHIKFDVSFSPLITLIRWVLLA